MIATMRTCVLAAAVLALPAVARADGWHLPPIKVDVGAKAWFNVHILDWKTNANLAPWYLYFPYDARFQTPPPMGPYPNWPVPVEGPVQGFPGPAAAFAPLLPPAQPAAVQPGQGFQGQGPPVSWYAPAQPTMTQPVGYFYSSTPGYWYGR